MRHLVPQRYPVDKSLSFFSLIMALLWIVHELSCLNSPPRQLIIMRKCPATLCDGTLQLVSLILINWIMISLCSFWTTGARNDKAKSRLLSPSFTGCNYSISTWSSRVFSVRDLTQLKRGSWENTKFLEGIQDFTIAWVASLAEVLARHVVRKKTCIRDSGWDDRSSGWGRRTPLPLFQTLYWSKHNRGRNSFIAEK